MARSTPEKLQCFEGNFRVFAARNEVNAKSENEKASAAILGEQITSGFLQYGRDSRGPFSGPPTSLVSWSDRGEDKRGER